VDCVHMEGNMAKWQNDVNFVMKFQFS